MSGHTGGLKMLLKFALVLALGSLWAVVARYGREPEDEAGLTREVEAQLQALRNDLFRP